MKFGFVVKHRGARPVNLMCVADSNRQLSGLCSRLTEPLFRTAREMKRQIAELEKQAERLRKEEAAEAHARIKEAIKVCDFTAADLGLAPSRLQAEFPVGRHLEKAERTPRQQSTVTIKEVRGAAAAPGPHGSRLR